MPFYELIPKANTVHISVRQSDGYVHRSSVLADINDLQNLPRNMLQPINKAVLSLPIAHSDI